MIKHPLEDLIETYLYEKDITTQTREVYQTILKQYIAFIKTNHISHATTQDVEIYLDVIRLKGCSAQWIRLQITVLKGLYHYLSMNQIRLGLDVSYAYDIMESIKNVRIEKRISKPILTPDQSKHLILFLKDHRRCIWHYRDYALIYLMITTGLRSIEARRARVKDLKMIHGVHILYVQGKGRNSSDEFVKISNGLYEAITDYIKKRKDQNPYLFVSRSKRSTKPMDRMTFQGILKRILRDSGLEDTHITAHSLRHTAATLNLKRGGTLEETKRLLRHVNMTNTLIYTHAIESHEDQTISKLEDFILGENHQT